MANSTDDFFDDFNSPPKKTATSLGLKSKQQRQPPPAPAARGTMKPSSSYHSKPSGTAQKPPPPPPPKPSARATTKAASSTTTASTNNASSSYYGGGYQNNQTSSASTNPYINSSSSATTTTQESTTSNYHYSSAPAPAAAAPAAYNYGAPQPAPQVMSHSAPAPQMMNNHTAPAAPQVMNPYMLNTQAPGGNGFSGSMDNNAATFSGTMDTNAAMSGTMDSSAQQSSFIPKAPSSLGAGYDPSEFEHEPPLLEELGINVEHILGKMRSVALPLQRFGGNMDATVIQDADLAGPIALALLLGGELMFSGKLQFGYIYGFGLFGCFSMTLVLNFMSPNDAISFWTVTSILGYSLLPVNILAAVKLLVVNLGNLTNIGLILGILTVLWCTVSSTRLMEQGCGMRNQRYLIAYPIGLLYTAFVMITIF